MARRKLDEPGGFSISFVDVFANTLGALVFILVIMVLMIVLISPCPSPEPLIVTKDIPTAFNGVPYKIYFSGKPKGEKYTWEVIDGSLPPGFDLRREDGMLRGVPQNVVQGQYLFKVRLSSANASDTCSYTLQIGNSEISPLMVLTDQALPKALEEDKYPLTLAAAGGKPPYKWKVTNGNLEGLTLNSNGNFEGTVSMKQGTYPLTVMVKDELGNNAEKDLELIVLPKQEDPAIIRALSIRSDSLPDGIMNKKYHLVLACEGGYPPYKWTSSDLIPAFGLNQDGTFSGTPDNIDEMTFQVTVSDSKENKVTKQLKLNILPPQRKLTPLDIKTPANLPKAVADQDYTLSVTGSGGLPPYRWLIGNTTLGNEQVRIGNDGLITGRFSSPGMYQLPVTLKDSLDGEVSKTLMLEVLPPLMPLSISMQAIPYAVKGFSYNLPLSATGGMPPYRWDTFTSVLPEAMKVESGQLTGTPGQPFQGEIGLRVTDQLNNSDSVLVFLEVLESGQGSIVHKLELLTSDLPTFLTGDSLNFHLSTRGGGIPLRWDISGSLPDNVEFANGQLTGKIRSEASSELTISVSDVSGQKISKRFLYESHSMVPSMWKLIAVICAVATLVIILLLIYFWTVIRKNKKSPLKILTRAIPHARVSAEYSVQLAAEGGVAPYKWQIIEGTLPSGLTLSDDGIISGVPVEAVELVESKEYKITVQVTDKLLKTEKQEL